MNNIHDIMYQNIQDHFTLMYADVAISLRDICGAKAETVIRRAVQLLGKDRGNELRAAHEAKQLDTNIANLFLEERDTKKRPADSCRVYKD